LKADDRGDESTLRLSLLWNELREKASETPTAVLGLLDIVNSQKGPTRTAFTYIVPLITRALSMLGSAMAGESAWTFLEALVGKLARDDTVPDSLWQAIETSARSLSEESRDSTLAFLEADPNRTRSLSKVILRGVGDGFAHTKIPISASEFSTIPAEVAAEMLVESPPFAKRILSETKDGPSEWVRRLTSVARSSDPSLKGRLREALFRFMDSDDLGGLASTLLEGATTRDYARIAADLLRSNKANSIGVFDAVVEGARETSALPQIREALMASGSANIAKSLLRRTIRAGDQADLAWLLNSELTTAQKCHLAVEVIDDAPDRALRSLPHEISQKLAELLLTDVSTSAADIGRLLSVASLPSGIYFDAAYAILPHLRGEGAHALRNTLIARAFSDADLNDGRIAGLVNSASETIEPKDLIRGATERSISPKRLGRNLELLTTFSEGTKVGILENIDELSARLIRRGDEPLGAAAYGTWADLLESASHFKDAQLRAAMPVLAFAIRQTSSPVSPLIVAAFPVVYQQLLQSKGDEDFGRWPALFTLPISYFVDWDRAKSARRDLVDSYVSSGWPPADLLVTAIKAGIETAVLKRLVRQHRGREYLERALRDLDRLEPWLKSRIWDFASDPQGSGEED
jgi:hypothetical protein